jgi:glutamine cyclotransferase
MNLWPQARPIYAICGAMLAAFAAIPAMAASCGEPLPLGFKVEGKISRSGLGFTQGLEFRDGKLYESTGRIEDTTRLNTISLSGQVTTLADLGGRVYGEGLTILGDEIFQLTWQDHLVFVYDLAGTIIRRMENPHLGWGLANDGRRLILSDGEGSIYFTDPKTFAIQHAVKVRSNTADEIKYLNELEFVDGKLYGNIFTTRTIVRLDPETGCVDAAGEMNSLWDFMTADEKAHIESSREYVLNGIAYDRKAGLFYLTGKKWPSIFVGRFVEGPR